MGFKYTITWYKPLIKVTRQTKKQYFNFLINLSFQGVNRVFAIQFNNATYRTSHLKYTEPTVKITSYNVIINKINFFDQPVNNDERIYDKSVLYHLKYQ